MATFKSSIGTCGTVAAAAYTAPGTGPAIITSAVFCNITNGDVAQVSVSVTKGGNTKHVLYQASIPPGGTLTLKPEAQIILEAGNSLNVQADQSGAVDYVISATEL
jgi:hypothetical protein